MGGTSLNFGVCGNVFVFLRYCVLFFSKMMSADNFPAALTLPHIQIKYSIAIISCSTVFGRWSPPTHYNNYLRIF